MKRVMLVHSSGAEYGPFELIENRPTNDWYYKLGLENYGLANLGFTVREVVPEKITITKEQALCAIGKAMRQCVLPSEVWQALVDASKGEGE